jgi:hypothetical protein
MNLPSRGRPGCAGHQRLGRHRARHRRAAGVGGNPIAYLIKKLDVSKPTAGRAVEALEKAGALFEITGKKRDRSWAYQSYLDRLRVGSDLETPIA